MQKRAKETPKRKKKQKIDDGLKTKIWSQRLFLILIKFKTKSLVFNNNKLNPPISDFSYFDIFYTKKSSIFHSGNAYLICIGLKTKLDRTAFKFFNDVSLFCQPRPEFWRNCEVRNWSAKFEIYQTQEQKRRREPWCITHYMRMISVNKNL